MKNVFNLFFYFAITLCLISCNQQQEKIQVVKEEKPLPEQVSYSKVELQLVKLETEPIIDSNHPDAVDIRFGFEGGTARKVNGKYYIFTTENLDEPKTAAVRLGIWESEDGTDFKKHSVIVETNYDWGDRTHRMAPWSPMAVYDDDEGLWKVFHVGYRKKANATNVYNMSGRIFRYDSKKLGIEGITGPYGEGGWIDLDDDPDWFEGEGKILSFYPYKVGDDWWAFYGANSVAKHVDATGEEKPEETFKFYAGLVKSEGGLEDKWVRQRDLNPVYMDSSFIENNVVSQIDSNLYLTVYDGANKQEISYSWSKDGIHWQPEQLLVLENAPKEIKIMRTPLGLIDEGNDIYSLFFTAFDGNNPDKIEPM